MLFALMWVVFSVLLYHSSFTSPSLVINVDSRVAERSQLFYGKDAAYTQASSAWQSITPGENRLVFPLQGDYSSMRWDLLQEPGSLKVNDIYFSFFGKKQKPVPVVLEPLNDIVLLGQIASGGMIVTTANAKDPQVNVIIDVKAVSLKEKFASAGLGFLIAFCVIICILFKSIFLGFLSQLEDFFARISLRLRADGFKASEIAWLFVIGCVFYSYFLSSFSFSIDDEMAAVRQDPAVWVTQGRWFVYLIERFLFAQSSIPFAPYILLVLGFSVSYALILRVHRCVPDWKSYALYPVFCAFPTWWAISEFYSNVPAVAFGIFFISLSLYLAFLDDSEQSSSPAGVWLKNSAIVLMLSCATAAYQALLLVYVTMLFGALLFRSRHHGLSQQGGQLLKHSFLFLMKNAVWVVLSVLCYGLISAVAQHFIAVSSGYIDKFIDYNAWLTQPGDAVSAILQEMKKIYSGDSTRYGADIGLASLVITGATLSLWCRHKGIAAVRLLLWAGVLIMPFGLHVISAGGPPAMRAMLAIAYVSWLACLLMLSVRRRAGLVLAGLLVGLFQLQIFSVTSQYMASATITQAHDRMLAADIYRRIGELSPSFDRNTPVEVDFFGLKPVKTVYGDGWWAPTQGSFFAWDVGNIERMLTYMKVMGYQNLSAPPNDQRIAMTPVFLAMPVWPAMGSVQKVGDRYLVRLSQEPDPLHASYVP